MKHIALSILLSGFSLVAFAQDDDEMKLEGNCTGTYANGKQVSFTYFSDFNGCTNEISAAIRFSAESGSGYIEGKRVFENNLDIYTLESYNLTFEDSTRNTGGIFSYVDKGIRESIPVICRIRSYEYDECE